jgi:serine/threonine protein kinase
MEKKSVEDVCDLLSRSHLLTPEQVRHLVQTWRAQAGSATDGASFCRWLVSHNYLTAYHADLVQRGKVDHFFFGPYKILERVGKGRMAGIYKAIHTLGQAVAIKVLPPSKAKDPQILARFQRETRLAMRLKHPNAVRTYQAGLCDDLYYLVMEYLEGETLEDVILRRRTLPPDEVARLGAQALEGLQHIHEQGMIHRDLKPGNLMLVGGSPGSTQGATVKIVDIGLGKELFDAWEPSAEAALKLTNEGALLGTPEYMAPEQANDPRTADIRSDIYSLGCTLYQALAGQVPFSDKNLVRLLMRHTKETPRPFEELNIPVPEGLQQVVGKMLAKDPAKRYPTPERAAQALQALLDAPPEPPPQPEDRMRAYLEWLDEQPGDPDAALSAAANASSLKDGDMVPILQAAPAADSEEPERPRRPARKRKPKPVAPRPKQRPAPAEEDEDEDEGSEEGRTGLNRRDVLMIAAGGAGLVLLALAGYGVAKLLRGK